MTTEKVVIRRKRTGRFYCTNPSRQLGGIPWTDKKEDANVYNSDDDLAFILSVLAPNYGKCAVVRRFPQGTTQAQWDAYEIERKEHELRMEKIKPYPVDYVTEAEYIKALDKWVFESLVSAPNEPGYYRANND